ncbi:MAG TPA: xanthine dehydrogenase family protein subunit M [Acidimicrobiales bacterium]|nr:xanthine dehydrogenase family protein subunit M [Acidimicrobiales bacterium]
MKPASFEYRDPDTLDEAVALLAAAGEDAKALAGGQSLVPMLNMRLARFETLVDLNRIEALTSVRLGADEITLGAMVRQSDVEELDAISSAAPLLALATPFIGHFQIRNRGTVGGSIAHADPAAEYPAVAVALDATMELLSVRGSRSLPASEFFTGTWTTAAEADEILTSVTFPAWGPAGFAVEEVARRHGDFAIAGTCVGTRLDGDGRVDRAAVALFGVGPTPVRASKAESDLLGQPPSDVDPESFGWAAAAELDPPSDLHASAGLRRRIAAAVVRRAIVDALDQAKTLEEARHG